MDVLQRTPKYFAHTTMATIMMGGNIEIMMKLPFYP